MSTFTGISATTLPQQHAIAGSDMYKNEGH